MRHRTPGLTRAAALFLSEATVRTHVSRILAKLDLRDRAWSIRATTSLPAPGAPLINTLLPVGATRSICWRSDRYP